MKKKSIVSVLTAMVVASFAGCANTPPAPQPAGNTVAEAPAKESTVSKAAETPTPTAQPTVQPTATPEPATSPEVTPEATETPLATPEVQITPFPTELPKPEYTYTDKSATMYAKSSVNIRSLPSTDGEKVGHLSTNDEVAVTGVCNETGWYRLTLNGEDAYVSGNYLQTEKVVVQQATTQNTPAQNAPTQSAPTQNVSQEAGVSQEAPSAGQEAGQSQGSGGSQYGTAVGTIDGATWYEAEDGTSTLVNENGNVVQVVTPDKIGNGQTDLPPEMTEEDWELFHQMEELFNSQP